MANEKDRAGRPEHVQGGYHSRGVPGEEGEARRQMRVIQADGRGRRVTKSRPLKGGGGAEAASADRLEAAPFPRGPGASVFVVARKGADFLDTPVFHAGESGDEEAVAIFTTREAARRYIEQAGWAETDEVSELTPSDLAHWLGEARGDGVRLAAIDPDRERQLAGEPQQVLFLTGPAQELADVLARPAGA